MAAEAIFHPRRLFGGAGRRSDGGGGDDRLLWVGIRLVRSPDPYPHADRYPHGYGYTDSDGDRYSHRDFDVYADLDAPAAAYLHTDATARGPAAGRPAGALDRYRPRSPASDGDGG